MKNEVSKTESCENCHDEGTLPDGSGCSECCEHRDLDHFICLDCGKELDPGVFIDQAMDSMDR